MKKYLVIGNPIDHSLSPKLHNSWLKENNIEASYDKIKLNINEIESLIDSIKQQKIVGCNVTVPFKKTVIPLPSAGGLSKQPSIQEGYHAHSWAENIWADTLN